LLVCHGLGANRTEVLRLLPVGDALEANVLVFDFRGHGDSDGHTISFGRYEKLDVLAAVRYLRTQRPNQARAVIGLGRSMGSSALVAAAAEIEPPLRAVILDSGFTAAVDVTDSILDFLPKELRPCVADPAVWLASLDTECWLPDVRPIDLVRRVRAPLLIIHARGDRLIPVEHGMRLYARAAEPKALWLADTGGHCSAIDATSEYAARVKGMLRVGSNSKGLTAVQIHRE
jgi:pimeloyl-ACP methyl ester carboxylesterase